MLTELDKIVSIAMAAGFFSGSFQSILDYILKSNEERESQTVKKIASKFMYLCLAYSILLGAMTFVLAIWDTSTSVAQLYRFSIAMAICFGIMPLQDRLWSFIFAKLKKTSPLEK